MRRPFLTATLALVTSSGLARAETPPLSFACEGLEQPPCDEVVREVQERFSQSGREVLVDGAGLPSAVVMPGDGGSVHVEVRVRGRPSQARTVSLVGEASPAWTVALTVEQMVLREEAAASRGPRRRREPRDGNGREPPEPSAAYWLGAEGGAALSHPAEIGLAMRAGLVGGRAVPGAQAFLRSRLYGELLFLGPFSWKAIGLAGGPAFRLADRRHFGLTFFIEGFARVVFAHRDADADPDEDKPEGRAIHTDLGVGLWLAVLGPRWSVRPFLAAGIGGFLRGRPCFNHAVEGRCVTSDENEKPTLIEPAVTIGAFLGPGG